MNNTIRNIQLTAVLFVLFSTIVAFFLEVKEMYDNILEAKRDFKKQQRQQQSKNTALIPSDHCKVQDVEVPRAQRRVIISDALGDLYTA